MGRLSRPRRRNLVRLKLDIATVLPIHGATVGFEQVRLASGQPQK